MSASWEVGNLCRTWSCDISASREMSSFCRTWSYDVSASRETFYFCRMRIYYVPTSTRCDKILQDESSPQEVKSFCRMCYDVSAKRPVSADWGDREVLLCGTVFLFAYLGRPCVSWPYGLACVGCLVTRLPHSIDLRHCMKYWHFLMRTCKMALSSEWGIIRRMPSTWEHAYHLRMIRDMDFRTNRPFRE
jgi:hypothetical protein